MLTILDVAGNPTGGAGRWRHEAKQWVSGVPDSGVRLIGLDERVQPAWLLQRELIGWSARRIAANNVGFVGGRGPRIVLLRNALHFLRRSELQHLPQPRSHVQRQKHIVMIAATRADTIVVPCSDMAERVASAAPRLTPNIVVRHHPITVSSKRRPPSAAPYVLYPTSPAPHKDLAGSLTGLVEALTSTGSALRVRATAPREALGAAGCHSLVDPVGVQPLEAMGALWAEAAAVYAPSHVESFGYPVAEARAIGVPVIAVDTPQNREIGGVALVGFVDGSRDSLANAIERACSLVPAADPSPFDPGAYFSWLTAL